MDHNNKNVASREGYVYIYFDENTQIYCRASDAYVKFFIEIQKEILMIIDGSERLLHFRFKFQILLFELFIN